MVRWTCTLTVCWTFSVTPQCSLHLSASDAALMPGIGVVGRYTHGPGTVSADDDTPGATEPVREVAGTGAPAEATGATATEERWSQPAMQTTATTTASPFIARMRVLSLHRSTVAEL